MKTILKAFKQFLGEIWKDSMLAIMLFVPILAGFFFKFAIPQLEIFLTDYFKISEILSPYYLLFDAFLTALPPLMFSFAGAMVMLGESDIGLSEYLSVTPLCKSGYMVSRIVIPTIISIVYGVIIALIFSLSGLFIFESLILSSANGFISVIISMIIVSISTNKVEGMALSKLSSIILLGLPLPFFVTGKVQYLASFLPSFWLGKTIVKNSFLFLLPFLAVSIIWLFFLQKRFIKKLI
ncbi:MAG: hypothetical protein A2Y17_02445 [Clostridiales bacterium GWF2_38_85]|nr:MAG: hypothetical protein A2Y17_02445 [Clostridiales bacterium GWF2_38_85]HBL85058.1 ABC transporter permease [Clostridiales bacterium]